MGDIFIDDHHPGEGLAIGAAKGDLLLAHWDHFHTGNHRIKLLKAQCRDQGIETLRRKLALRLHLLAQGVSEIDIEADGLIFAVGGDKRRIGRGSAKMERLG